MASHTHNFPNVLLARITEDGQITAQHQTPLTLTIIKSGNGAQISVDQQGSSPIEVASSSERARVGRQGLVITMENESQSTLMKFPSEIDCRKATQILNDFTQNVAKSIFTERTDKDSATQYFQFYSYLSQQQNMMQDYVRTSTYQQAMLANTADFAGKVVLDVGAGSGLLSFFAAQAGAKKVYAVEASNMAPFCQKLVDSNGLSDIITVISAKIEETELPEKVDTIISEPIGYMLFNERMIETYLHAKKFLKPGGKMFPTEGHLFIAPFHDEALFQEQSLKSNFWCQQQFHGIDLTALRLDSHSETFKQPIVDTFAITTCTATANKFPVDFLTCEEQDLYVIDVPLQFTMTSTGHIHGLAFWFDLAFIGSSETIWLSTAPTEPLTHWYQVRCLLVESVFAKQGQTVNGRLTMRANSRQSYDVEISVKFPCSNRVSTNVLDLKNPYFRYGTQVQVQPPQDSTISPTEQYYSNQAYPVQAVNGTDLGALMNQPQNMTLLAQQVNATSISQSPPINPGSIPALGNVAFGVQAMQNRTSVGGGIAPSQVSHQVVSQNFGLSNQFMIGDYAATTLTHHKPN